MRIPILLLVFLPLCYSYKILVFAPTISRSHMISNGRIADTLAKAGHDVIMFEPDFMGLLGTVNATKVAKRWPVTGFSSLLIDALKAYNADLFEETNAIALNMQYSRYQTGFNQLCKELLDKDDIMAQLRAEKFDGFFGEHINPCGNGLAHALGIKSHFWVSSCAMTERQAWLIGMPSPVSYVPVSYELDIGTKMSFVERIYNLFYFATSVLFAKIPNIELTNIFRDKFGPDFPSIDDIAGSSDLVFVASEEFIDLPRPTLPNVINIGGLGIEDKQMELNEPFASEMSKGLDGVVLFSLGTNVDTSSLPKFAMKSVIETAAKIPNVHFIIKIDKNDEWSREVAKDVPNVFLSSWVPQPAILAHRRLRLFITHAGYNGVMESARAGVPLITMPFMFDQTRNSRAIAERGWGIALRRQVLRDAPSQLKEAIEEMLDNNKYKEKAVRISNLVRKKPFNATERLVKYTEFVLENDGIKELLVEGRNLNFIIYFNLDVIIPFCIVAVLLLFLLSQFVRSMIAKVRTNSQPKRKVQ